MHIRIHAPPTNCCTAISMELGILNSCLVIITLLTTALSTASAQDDVCSGDSCNCQLSNIQALGNLIQDLVANTTRANTGVSYIRWGRTTCPSTPGTELVYTLEELVETFGAYQEEGQINSAYLMILSTSRVLLVLIRPSLALLMCMELNMNSLLAQLSVSTSIMCPVLSALLLRVARVS